MENNSAKSLIEYWPVPCMRPSSFCCLSDSLGCFPRSRPFARAIFMPSRVRRRIRSASNSANVARMLKNILPMGSAGSYRLWPSASVTPRPASSSVSLEIFRLDSQRQRSLTVYSPDFQNSLGAPARTPPIEHQRQFSACIGTTPSSRVGPSSPAFRGAERSSRCAATPRSQPKPVRIRQDWKVCRAVRFPWRQPLCAAIQPHLGISLQWLPYKCRKSQYLSSKHVSADS